MRRKPSIYSGTQSAVWETGSSGPFAQRAGIAVMCQPAVGARVSHLFRLCCPPYVAGLVVAVVVDAFNTVQRRRALANVGEEIIERVQPPLGDTNTSLTVMLKVRVSDIRAALFQGGPRDVFGRLGKSVRDLLLASQRGEFTLTTSATLSRAVPQRRNTDTFDCAAVASTDPSRLFADVVIDAGNSDQSAKSLSSDVLRVASHTVNDTRYSQQVTE